MFNTNKYNNEQLANRNFVLGAAFGRLAIGSVDKLLAQINCSKSFDGKWNNQRRFWESSQLV